MGLAQLVNAHYNNKVRPLNLKQIVLPQAVPGAGACEGATATGGAATTYGVWVDVALKAAVLVDTLVVGILVDTPSGAEIYTIDIGSTLVTVTAAGVTASTNYALAADVETAGVQAAAHRCEIRKELATHTAGVYLPTMLPFPIYYHALTDGILARIATVGGGGETANISVLCIQNFE